ncbi:hypothetical protein N7466_006928 [Penicillium verhagenii]|uniref:uncharacterized protein n=1 Tax=Penicillium verhagenii TaxID=1562060 RepID=UPI00254564A7|nr:uncharacterized protein N7466_006928 [Penicillium verhagenii]KAJ5927972.1 hypothetical protein N7466_006928 [Penicillium verhagenii]
MSIDSSPGSTEPTPTTTAATSGGDTGTKSAQEKETQPTLSTSIISTLCSPFSTLLSATTLYQGSKEDASPPNSISKNEQEQEQSKSQEQEKEPQPELLEPEPEPYYKPNEVPLFKTLQKKRLSGTRTKQLLRAAGRAYNDPPPPPELGTCCGSSCDPCVNTLWREERDVWRERWGDRKVEGEYADGRKDLEW